jgi:hypothetical protein
MNSFSRNLFNHINPVQNDFPSSSNPVNSVEKHLLKTETVTHFARDIGLLQPEIAT